jgi:hypothetical protein
MRVAFFEPSEPGLTNYRKGQLFERLTKRLVEASGYRDVSLRQKHNSLEYDVEARLALSATRLVGEAKAVERNIEGQVVSAFVGKLFPLATAERIDGLFVSVSPFTPDARDYLASLDGVLNNFNLSLTTLVGDEIPAFLRDRLGHASEDVLRERVKSSLGLQAFDVWLVVSEHEEFFVATCGPNRVETPTHFALFQTDGADLDIGLDLGGRLQLQLSDLTGLTLAQPAATQTQLAPKAERLPSVDPGAGWFDYRFPAPPDCFIGRQDAVEEVKRALADVTAGDTALRTVQILSRSGVGKSSLLLKLADELPDADVVTIDARSLRVPSEARLVVAALVERANHSLGSTIEPPRTQDGAGPALEEVGNALAAARRAGVIELDQFESTLALPTVFAAVLDLIATTTSRGLPVIWVLARKNDLSTTFDESARVDLDRLNNQSKAIALDDFSAPEGGVLLERLSEELGRPLRPGLAEAISTFSAGFPWLHKRLCAHVLSMRDEGVSQEDLLQQGLRAEDLFEEDMAGLSEADKALLRRIAAYLPSTGAELARDLESEISAQRLREKLNEFLGQKLLRLTGDVFDTYNDVFKTYLVTDQVPFKSRYIFRVSPKAALDLLPDIAEVSPATIASFQKHIGGSSRIALLNKLRELRLLGLISPERGRVALTPEAQAALESDTLGELLRTRLRGNALVLRVLDLLAARETITMDAISEELRAQLPHLDVADATWKLYARQLAAWLDFSGLAYIEGEALRIREFPADDSLRGRDFYGARFVPNTFMPSVRPKLVVELTEALRSGPLSRVEVYGRWGNQHAPGMLRDAETLDLVEIVDDAVRTASQGEILHRRTNNVTELDVAQLALMKPNVKALVVAATEAPLDVAGQRELISGFGSANWTDGTWKWRLGILMAWLTATGQVRVRRGVGLIRVIAGE